MKQSIIIKHGAEFVCLKDDNGECSRACPNLITFEGYLIKEAVFLSRSTMETICALQEKNHD